MFKKHSIDKQATDVVADTNTPKIEKMINFLTENQLKLADISRAELCTMLKEASGATNSTTNTFVYKLQKCGVLTRVSGTTKCGCYAFDADAAAKRIKLSHRSGKYAKKPKTQTRAKKANVGSTTIDIPTDNGVIQLTINLNLNLK